MVMVLMIMMVVMMFCSVLFICMGSKDDPLRKIEN
jgi:hypothetical protein